MRDLAASSMVDHAAGGVLPAFVLGWDSVPPGDVPPFFLTVEHQLGGLACLQASISGLVLPLHENRERALCDPSPLLEAFRCVAESQPRATAHAGHALVEAWGHTHGDPMTPADLEEWDALLARYYALPPLVTGVEAMLGFAVEPPVSLVGWRALTMPDAGGALELLTVDARISARLRESRPSGGGDPRLHLLWESSD